MKNLVILVTILVIAAQITCYTEPDKTKIKQTQLEIQNVQDFSLHLKITKTATASKTTMPDIDMTIHTYKITGTCEEGSTFETATQEPEIKIKLIPGRWIIAAEAVNENGIHIAYGKEEADIEHHKTTNLEIQVLPYTGFGKLKLTAEWEQDLAEGPHIEAQISRANGIPNEMHFKIEGNKASANITAPAGYYILRINLYDKAQTMTAYIGGTAEVVRVIKNQETAGNYKIIHNPDFGYGEADIKLIADLKLPIEIEIKGKQETCYQGLTMELEASAPYEPDESKISYEWNINGLKTGQGKTYTTENSLPAGEYQLDVTAFNETGDRAGSASHVFKIINEEWYDPDYEHRQRIMIDEIEITQDLKDIPFMIKLTPETYDYEKTKPDGSDIRFTQSDGTTELKYSMEQWDNKGESIIRVKVPLIKAGARYNYIWMYTGNINAGHDQDPENVYDNAFAGVWHLNDCEISTGSIKDTTKNSRHGTPSAGLGLEAQGSIGKGVKFDNFPWDTTDRIKWKQDQFGFDFDDAFTFEIWLKQNSIIDRTVLSKKDHEKGYAMKVHSDGDIEWKMETDAVYHHTRSMVKRVNAGIDDDNWHYIVVTYDGSRDVEGLRIYIDGTESGIQYQMDNIYTWDSMLNFSRFYLGRGYSTIDAFEGNADEFRISDEVRSPEWINAQYKIMTGQGWSFGREEE